LKNVTPDSWAKLCLERAIILSQILSVSHGKEGLDFSDLASKAAPALRKVATSFAVI